ncbi:hypothetical protein DDB_G0270970 [Dictyostelium discoideum AX4]|uniref:Uncharacterized protein n=1 Tax=Dictyostelium discoideum TaxID=44689 RepID=Q55D25_DICDI|nr:hypothetical protein DDB_G0270970 [Dictyostelium discoideum AX4]EAL72835.1 hypothetical protein DDB_G0270970 [Dictyostelium discoideum AX4]|eukprot:XP_646306.1 hypothetical protein DDB_G0270970 [Dictyostelium discoideum AX4]
MEFSNLLDLVLGNSNLNQSKQLIDLNEELIYLSQFIKNKNSLIDWVSSTGIKQGLIKTQLIEKKPVPHTFEERITEDAPVRSWITGIVTLGISTIGGKLKDEKIIIKSVPVTRKETFTNKKEIMTDVAVTEEVTVDEEVEKIVKEINIVKEQPEIITKQIPVTKSRKAPKCKDEIKKVFDESSYNSDLSQIQNNINNSRNIIQSKLRSYHSSGVVTDFNKEEPLQTNGLEKEYLDLISLWRNTEYSIFNSHHPNKYSKVKTILLLSQMLPYNKKKFIDNPII